MIARRFNAFHHLAKGLSLSSVHDSGIHSLLIPETRLLYQYSVPGSKHTCSKLRSLPSLFPISLTVYPNFDFCYSHFMPYRMTPSVRHRAIEVHYYYYCFINEMSGHPKDTKILLYLWSGKKPCQRYSPLRSEEVRLKQMHNWSRTWLHRHNDVTRKLRLGATSVWSCPPLLGG